VHEEFHGREFARRGGLFEMVQLWVNLPAKDKQAPPGYQSLLASEIPVVDLPGGAGTARVIAGELAGAKGPARTFTPIDVWDLRLEEGKTADLVVQGSRTTGLVVLQGALRAGDSEPVRSAEVALFDRAGERIKVGADEATTALLLSGQPIGEPIVGQGPFVMNRPEEILQAMLDYRDGRMGHLT
jgi:redox-sensitive bicupin YhaK (pirin superfamily)